MSRKRKKQNLGLYAMIAVMIVLVLIFVYIWYQLFFGSAYNTALQSENANDICATPPGYTDEQWREHMGHHPDRYAQCLT